MIKEFYEKISDWLMRAVTFVVLLIMAMFFYIAFFFKSIFKLQAPTLARFDKFMRAIIP